MANIKVYKDTYSFHIFNLLDSNESLSYDFSFSKLYTVILGTGDLSIGTDQTSSSNLESIGLYRVPINEKLNCTSINNAKAAFTVSFLLDDTVLMNELIPNSSIRSQMLSSDSKLTEFHKDFSNFQATPKLNYDETPGNSTITLSDIETKITEGLLL